MSRSLGWLAVVLVAFALGPTVQPAAQALAEAANSALRIVYPGEGSKLPFLRRSFVFGSTEPGATVSVNGSAALVAPSGGWIAFVPFAPGDFRLHVVSRRAGNSVVADRIVSVAQPLRTLAPSPARVDSIVAPAPTEDMTLESGDSVHLFIKASTGARVTASVEGAIERSPLVETQTSSLNPSDKERILGDVMAGGDIVGGLYEGDVRLPAAAAGPLRVSYTVSAGDGTEAKATAKGAITITPSSPRRVGFIVLSDHNKDIDARPYGIVESEPDGGWLFFPPERTPFEISGAAGDYYRVALGTSEHAWIQKQSLSLAPRGTPPPRPSLEGVVVLDSGREATVLIHLSGRAPFWVTETADEPSLRIRVFGASADTDFVRYGNDRSNVSEVRWDQLEGGVASVNLKLRQHTMWGYHAQWDGNDIKLVIKKPPLFRPAPASALQGLLVVIDPGHSPDTGAIGPLGTRERDINLAIAKRLATRLESMGARTMLTRTANIPVGLYDRTNLAARVGADVLISIHNNALPDGVDPFTHHGFSVYYYQPQSLELARAIHSAYGRHTELPDYGLYYDNLALARPTEEPAVLTESAFIMWPPEEIALRSPAFQEKLAAALADGMSRWAASMRSREGLR
ncbi:MAG: N-acetylmuramoyl-L-alanine amidase [Candidatus Eremiobacteraeota bacterium]|nr:N-acetylmuramoyl-L-alanine amidase [Candidatus Eremiobacteraeota bacterium]